MADNAPAFSRPATITPMQAPRADDSADSNPFRGSLPWRSFLPTNTPLFSSLAEGAFGAPTPAADYEKKVIDWLPPTSPGTWETPAPAAGLHRPQPQKPEPTGFISVPMAPPSRHSESPIDVVNTSAFAPVEQSPAKDEGESGVQEVARPQPLRIDSANTTSANPLLILASASQQQQQQQPPQITLASAFGMQPTDTVLASAEPGSSSGSEHNNVSPPSRGAYTRAPGLGPPPETPTSANGQSGAPYVCSVCGFASASKFHYNSHMNTHGQHQCTMCDYTSRTEGRLKKHMRESHTTEEQLAAGLDVTPPTPAAAAAAATSSSNSTNNSPIKEEEMDSSPEGALPGVDCGTDSLSSTLLGMLAKSSDSSMTSLLEQMRAITEKPLFGDGASDGLSLIDSSLGQSPLKEETPSAGGGGGSRRKMKKFKCKQCPQISQTKDEQWEHARTHIPADKQLGCDKCGFVTEYRHHLEYHQRNHAGVKPFQCAKCNYACVNKSMLNSHMKSHSNVYQFRCADCSYATKYCHSLKLHLKKYGHRRNTEGLTEAELLGSLSADNSPQTMRKDSTASFASTLSGPFTPFNLIKQEEGTQQMSPFPMLPTSQSINYATQMMRQHQFEQMMQQQPSHKCCMCEFSCGSQEELVRHNISHLLSNSSLYQALGVQASLGIPIQDRSAEEDHHTTTGSSPSGEDAVSHSNGSAVGSPLGSGRGSSDEGEGGSSRRKSSKPARIAIDHIGTQLLDKANTPDTTEQQKAEVDEAMDTSSSEENVSSATAAAPSEQLALPALPAPQPVQPMQQLLQLQMQPSPHMAAMRQALFDNLARTMRSQSEPRFRYECAHCNTGFGDQNMHAVHMTYHAQANPMQCSRCGLVSASPFLFYLHLLQAQHI